MRILGQVIEIYPSHVVISLPNQMLGHIPLPRVTDQLTERIEKLPEEGDSENEEDESEDQEDSLEAAAKRIPELQDIFRVGQYVKTIVTTVHAAGATASNTNLVKPKNETDRGSRRVVLSTVPKEMNGELSGKDLVAGYVSAAIARLFKALKVSTGGRGSGEECGGPWLRFGFWNQ
jgi:rRNA biogenesis protein RRP5